MIPVRLLRLGLLYALKGVEYVIDRAIERRERAKATPLTWKDVDHIRSQIRCASRPNTPTVKLPRTPNRYDE